MDQDKRNERTGRQTHDLPDMPNRMPFGRWRQWYGRWSCLRVGPQLRPYVEGEMSPAEAERVRRHLAQCPACEERAATFGAVIGSTRRSPAAAVPDGLAERLRERLAREPIPRASLWQRAARHAAVGGRGLSLGLSAAAAMGLALGGVLLAPAPRLTAEEITTRVQESWAGIQNYHCTLRTTIRYRGRTTETTREQWFSRPDRFRIESDEGQRWTTLIVGSEVVTYLPDARVVIHRPRRRDEPDLPFPFRSAADLQGDITIDALLERLRETRDAELVGREEVLGKECYVLKFRTMKPPTRRVRHERAFDCRIWIDGDTFLPLKVRMYCDRRTWSYTRATGLDVNRGLDPDTFRLRLPEGVRWVRGDVDPRLFEREGADLLNYRLNPQRAIAALTPTIHRNSEETHPTQAGRESPTLAARAHRQSNGAGPGACRAGRGPLKYSDEYFGLSPTWLPEGYHLVAAHARYERLRNRIERVVTLVLTNDDGDAITLVQEPATEEQRGVRESLGREVGHWPYPYVRLSGMRGGTWLRLMAASLPEEQAVRVFRGMRSEQEIERMRSQPAAAGAPPASVDRNQARAGGSAPASPSSDS